MQEMGTAFEIKRPATYNNLVHIQSAISKPQASYKPKIYNRYTYKKETQSKHNTKDSHQTTREEKKIRGKEDRQKQIQNN